VRNKTRLFCRTNTLGYTILVETTCVCIAVTSLLTEFRNGRLTFRAWLPFNYSSPFLFRIVYLHQLISLTVGSVLHVACDGLICGLLVHICCQIEIIECRLRKIVCDRGNLRDCVLQHNHVYELVDSLILRKHNLRLLLYVFAYKDGY